MARRVPALLLLSLSLSLLAAAAAADPSEREQSALQAFLAGTPHERPLQWDASLPTCAWTGIRCNDNATVTELHLPVVGLVDRVPTGTLSRLQRLRVLSLRDNHLRGPVPPDVLVLLRLRALYLQGNLLFGAVPTGLGRRLPALEHLVLSRNDLGGEAWAQAEQRVRGAAAVPEPASVRSILASRASQRESAATRGTEEDEVGHRYTVVARADTSAREEAGYAVGKIQS